jgi:hypothetical protein
MILMVNQMASWDLLYSPTALFHSEMEDQVLALTVDTIVQLAQILPRVIYHFGAGLWPIVKNRVFSEFDRFLIYFQIGALTYTAQ